MKILITAIVIGIGIIILLNSANSPVEFGALGGGNSYSGGVTHASSTASSTASSILARNVDRQYASICAVEGTGVVYLYETATNTGVVAKWGGFPIATTTNYERCYIVNSSHPYTGQIYGITTGGTTSLSIIEK